MWRFLAQGAGVFRPEKQDANLDVGAGGFQFLDGRRLTAGGCSDIKDLKRAIGSEKYLLRMRSKKSRRK